MRYLATHENSNRGSFKFPVELYNIDNNHPRYMMPFHWHIECEIIRVISGSFNLTLTDNTVVLKEGEAAFIPSGCIHGGTPNDCVYQCVVFSFERLIGTNAFMQEEYDTILGQGDYIPPKFNGSSTVSSLFHALEKRSRGHEFVVSGAICQIVGGLMSERGGCTNILHGSGDRKRINRIKKVLRLIRNDYSKPLTLKMLAEEAELNLQYLCKSFKRLTGKTPIDYLNYYRIECAAELLQMGEKNVTETAFACGFNDLSYFIKLFNRYKGVSPREYQKLSVI